MSAPAGRKGAPPSSTGELRAAVSGLLWLAAGEEAALLAGVEADETGTPGCWSAPATIAHNSDFRHQQITRLRAVREHQTPPDFPQIEHTDPETYAQFAQTTRREALHGSRSTTTSLLDELSAATDEDLLDPTRNPWLRGRKLWLQVVVRGFWHPLGHVGEYYQRHGQPERPLALYEHAVDTARYLGAPGPALGMACYSLACAQAVSGLSEEAGVSLAEAIALNEDLREAAAAEPDLEGLRASGSLSVLAIA